MLGIEYTGGGDYPHAEDRQECIHLAAKSMKNQWLSVFLAAGTRFANLTSSAEQNLNSGGLTRLPLTLGVESMRKYIAIGMVVAFLSGFVLAQSGQKQEEGKTQTHESSVGSQATKMEIKTD